MHDKSCKNLYMKTGVSFTVKPSPVLCLLKLFWNNVEYVYFKTLVNR